MANNSKKILITGAGSGIGLQTAITLAELGHEIIATTHSEKDAQKITELAQRDELSMTSFALDVTNKKDREKILKYDIDVLINNAGMGETGPLAEIAIEKVKNNFEVNLFGPLELTQLALQKMFKRDSGQVIFVSSLLGRITSPYFGSYSMTKFALSSGVEMMRDEIAQITKNVHISIVEPGAYHTGFNQKMMNKKFEWIQEGSYFFCIKEKLRTEEARRFKYTEVKDIKSIVNKIVQAVNAEKPTLRYSAPWWQALFVRIMRAAGK